MDVNSQPDGLNNFFNTATNKLGDVFNNPRAGQKPATEDLFNRTDGGQGIQLMEERADFDRLQQPGFTPMNYYRVRRYYEKDGTVKIVPFKGTLDSSGNYSDEVFLNVPDRLLTTEDNVAIDSKVWNALDKRQNDFKFSLQDFVKFNSGKNDFETSDGGNNRNPWERYIDQSPAKMDGFQYHYDNEDPVYFGFEIIIDSLNSPLLNGELETFLDKFGGDVSEIQSRLQIINQFKNELKRYFKFNADLGVSERYDPSGVFLKTGSNRRYYVKKVAGLDKLVEANTAKSKKSFIDYGSDNLTISFYEDTTLNLGTLASLYKELYWSRLKGKSMIPENLLRFDCEIIISELRNFTQIRKSGDLLEELKANLSRYKYRIYECQFFFNKMTHPDSIDMSASPVNSDTYDVEVSFKYSNMIFERYNPDFSIPSNGKVVSINNIDTVYEDSKYQQSIVTTSNVKDVKTGEYSNISPDGGAQKEIDVNDTIAALKAMEKSRINTKIKDPGSNPTERLLQNLKTAALREAQRRMNDQFRLLNNSIDKIRNSFGIGRMRAPTNVYDNTPGNRFFFDIHNSLRSFAGDTLTGLIGGG